MVETNRLSLSGIVFLIVILIIYPSCLSGTGNPKPTPVPTVPPRVLGDTNNFPWQESWRNKAQLSRDYQNVRNLITTGTGVLYMDYADDSLLKFAEANDGKLRWSVDLDGRIDSIVTNGDLVYVVGRAGQIVEAYDLQTGNFAWKSNETLPSHRAYFLQLYGKNLFAYEWINLIYIFNSETGEFVDKIQVPDIAEEFLLYLENEDWLLSKNEQVMFVKEGEIVWQTSLKGPPQKFPYIDNDMLIVRFDNDRAVFDGLAGLDLITGELIWQRADEFYSNFVIHNDLLYVVSKEAKILVLDPKSGQTVGYAELLPNNVSTIYPISAIAVNEDMLYVYFRDSWELIAFERVNE